ncbi:hypothetical protein GOP47_0008042 [Adiantum capillus-veneris]|uniref:Uncharacterized protein n=1 Tax=Adiantum capillus-veneris TaxID=13818 RepID=A0A9D4UYA2_ADICA|nr:hypothetical protein GOP47_0031047 [Adiantum capillus-veneris]KAI5075977.1 hypothetical protein GOP47_0008042 [Adiantum capillus-veneris]
MSATSLAKRKEIDMIALRYGFLITILCASAHKCEADVVCEELPMEWCAYSISSMGARCMLEGEKDGDNPMVYKCKTSSVETKVKGGWIEAEECMEACGLKRMTVGLFSQPPFDPQFFCSPRCARSCPHLHYLLLPQLSHQGPGSSISNVDVCLHVTNPHRSMNEVFEGSAHPPQYMSSGGNNADRNYRPVDGDGFPRSHHPDHGWGRGDRRHGWMGRDRHPGVDPFEPSNGGPDLAPSPLSGDYDYNISPSPSPYSDEDVD